MWHLTVGCVEAHQTSFPIPSPLCLNARVIYGPVTSSAVACRLRHGEAHNRCVLRKDVHTCRDATRTRNTLPPAGLQYNTGGLWPFTGISESPFITTLTSPQCRWDCGHSCCTSPWLMGSAYQAWLLLVLLSTVQQQPATRQLKWRLIGHIQTNKCVCAFFQVLPLIIL